MFKPGWALPSLIELGDYVLCLDEAVEVLAQQGQRSAHSLAGTSLLRSGLWVRPRACFSRRSRLTRRCACVWARRNQRLMRAVRELAEKALYAHTRSRRARLHPHLCARVVTRRRLRRKLRMLTICSWTSLLTPTASGVTDRGLISFYRQLVGVQVHQITAQARLMFHSCREATGDPTLA